MKIILTAGINPETNRKSLELAEKYDIVKPCLGFYPIQYNNGCSINQNMINKISKNKLKNKKLVDEKIKNNEKKFDIDSELRFIEKNKSKIAAIGEVGLDYKENNNIKQQKILFQKVINLTEKTII